MYCSLSNLGGAWWYRGCDTSNLNGRYLTGELPAQYIYQGMYWGEFRGPQYSLMQARMLIRTRDESSSAVLPVTAATKEESERIEDNEEEEDITESFV